MTEYQPIRANRSRGAKTAWAFFRDEIEPQIRNENKNADFKEIRSLAISAWKTLQKEKPEEAARFKQMNLDDRKRYT